MADLGIIFLRRRYPIHWYQSSYIFITGSMPFRYFWATLYNINSAVVISVVVESSRCSSKTLQNGSCPYHIASSRGAYGHDPFWIFLKTSTWFHNNRYYNGTIYIIDNNIVLCDIVGPSGYSSKTLQKGSCPYAPLDEVLRYAFYGTLQQFWLGNTIIYVFQGFFFYNVRDKLSRARWHYVMIKYRIQRS